MDTWSMMVILERSLPALNGYYCRVGYLGYDCDSGTEFAQPQLGNIHSVDGDGSASRFNNPKVT
jgi:hypothetical protein